MSTVPASCIVAEPGDKRTLCGVKADRVSVAWAQFVLAHTDGHNQPWCPTCHDLWKVAQ